jgi:hypothetical protein
VRENGLRRTVYLHLSASDGGCPSSCPLTLLKCCCILSSNFRQWTYKGTVAVRLGDFEEADDAFSESLRLQPSSHITYTKRSEVRLQLRSRPQAQLCPGLSGQVGRVLGIG